MTSEDFLCNFISPRLCRPFRIDPLGKQSIHTSHSPRVSEKKVPGVSFYSLHPTPTSHTILRTLTSLCLSFHKSHTTLIPPSPTNTLKVQIQQQQSTTTFNDVTSSSTSKKRSFHRITISHIQSKNG